LSFGFVHHCGRFQYVDELIGANMDSERAIRWLIAPMVLLAMAMTAATAAWP